MYTRELFLVMIVASFTLINSAQAAKQERPPIPIANDLNVEVRLTHKNLDVGESLFGRALAENSVGLISAVGSEMDRAAISKSDIRAASLFKTLSGYPFNEHYEAELHKSLSRQNISPNPKFSSVINAVAQPFKPGVGISQNLLVLSPRYALSANCLDLSVILTVRYVEQRLDKKNRLVERLKFQRAYEWRYRLPIVKGSTADDYAAGWNQVDPERLVLMLDQGIVQSVALFNYDFSEAGRDEDEKLRRGISFAPAPQGAVIKQGWVGFYEGIPGLVGEVSFDWQLPTL